MGLVLVVPYANEKSIEDFPLIVFFFFGSLLISTIQYTILTKNVTKLK